jgi:hypothetical protein
MNSVLSPSCYVLFVLGVMKHRIVKFGIEIRESSSAIGLAVIAF